MVKWQNCVIVYPTVKDRQQLLVKKMTVSLIAQLPTISVGGRQDAEKIMERVEQGRGCLLQTDERVTPQLNSTISETDRVIPVEEWCSRLLCGDNLLLMEAMLAGDPSTGMPPLKGKIDLIYIDPPFASRSNYRTCCTLKGKDGSFVLEQKAYSDTWQGGMAGYLRMLYPRLYLMRELLSEKGSLIVHLDWHAVHYVKVLLDDIFGSENFRNEIAWCYGGGGAAKRTYPKKHDLLLWYTKSSNWVFNKQFRPYTQGTLQRGLTAVKGDKYVLRKEGAGLDDWWAGKDVQKILSPTAYENLKFKTQKPEGLLTRIIRGHSDPGDLVADFFCGTGTTGAVAEKLGRRWIMADTSRLAVITAYKRLLQQGCRPFVQQSIASRGRKEPLFQLVIKQPVVRCCSADMTEVQVELDGLTYSTFEYLDQNEKIKEKIKELASWNPLELLEYWSVDPAYDGKTFRSRWQSCRGRDIQVNTSVKLSVPKVTGTRRICVKAVDVFGNGCTVCQTIKG